MTHAHHVIAALAQAEDDRADGGHAAGETAGRLGALEGGKLAFELAGGRIVDTRIYRMTPFAAEARRQLVIVGEGEERGLEDRRHDGAEWKGVVMGHNRRHALVCPVRTAGHERPPSDPPRRCG
jgi:hypothetical protein